MLAKVSTATISRFENGGKDIQLSSIVNIFSQLGMMDHRIFNFSEPNEKYDFDRDTIVFFAQQGDKKIRCSISREVLDDYFNGDGKDKLKVFKENRAAIEHHARRKYFENKLEDDGSIVISSQDF